MTTVVAGVDLFQGRDVLERRLDQIINFYAGRSDMSLSLVWDRETDLARPSPPAWFDVSAARVVVDGTFALQGANPAEVNPMTPEGRRAHPVLIGLFCHEAGHARASGWLGKAERVDPVVLRAAILLEEPRVESRHLQERPQDRPYLRAQSALIDLAPLRTVSAVEAEGRRWNVAKAALFTLGRVDAGVLEPEDIASLRPLLEGVLGKSLLDSLKNVWCQAVAVDDDDVDRMLDLGGQWVRLVGSPPAGSGAGECGSAQGGSPEPVEDNWADDGQTFEQGGGDPEPQEPGDAEGCESAGGEVGESAGGESATPSEGAASDGSEPAREENEQPNESNSGSDSASGETSDDTCPDSEASAAESELADAVEEALCAAESRARDELAADAPPEIDKARSDEAEQQAADSAEQKKAEVSAARALKRGSSKSGSRGSAVTGAHAPTDQDRVLARMVGKRLKEAQFREPDVTLVGSVMPPGRFRPREAMKEAAQRDMGLPVTAKPFKAPRYRRVEEPPISMGIMVDTSGSMSWACEVMASCAWAFATSLRHTAGTTACVAYGTKVEIITEPGTHPSEVTTFRARGSHEPYKQAFAVLDGALNLTLGRGVRVLVVVSDGQYGPDETRAVAETTRRMIRNGALPIWVHPKGALVPTGALSILVSATGRDRASGTAVDNIPAALAAALARAVREG